MGKGQKNRKRKGKEVAKATQASVSDDQLGDPPLATSAEQEVAAVVAGGDKEGECVNAQASVFPTSSKRIHWC